MEDTRAAASPLQRRDAQLHLYPDTMRRVAGGPFCFAVAVEGSRTIDPKRLVDANGTASFFDLPSPAQDHLVDTKMAPHLKLTYFNGAGRAELTRLVLHYGGIAFEDHRIDFAQFSELKPTLPLGQVPVLEVDGVVYTQSIAIARYAAKLAGLYPTDPLQALRVDMIADTFGDIGPPLSDIRFREKDEAVKAEKSKKFLEETLPKVLKVLEGLVQSKFFLGDDVSLSDFQVFDVITNKIKTTFPDFDLNAYPKLAGIVANVEALPAVAAYIKN